MKRLPVWVLILLIVVAASLFFYTGKEKEKKEEKEEVRPEAVILFMEGDVKIKGFGTDRWRDAASGMSLLRDDSLKTGIDSWAEIGLGENLRNVARVNEETAIEIMDLGPVKLRLLNGELRSLVEELEKDSTFEIRTPSAICGARGTGWDTKTDGQEVIVNTYEDEVFFNSLSKDGSIIEESIIVAGKRGMLKEPQEPIIIEEISPEKTQDWNDWKSDLKERIRVKEGVATSPQKISKEKHPKVWVKELDSGDFQLMIEDEEKEEE